jgi:serine/threonine protein kinase/alpha-beta hydrolase superfamily lysophospholipase
MHLNAGDVFQHYRVAARVGEGGMGVVYRARDTRLDRDVALKFMTQPRAGAGHADRFRREARALAALNHPNILTIHDIGEAGGLPFLVLEWIDGGTLGDEDWRPPLALREFHRVALATADALAAAHEQGIVHRDVKPGNVLVTADGRIKLADFGLAKFYDPDRDLTRTGAAIGTVAYMSPEQAGGGDVGSPSDVFSFGVMAYNLLTGHLPFNGDSPGAVIGAILDGRHTPITQLRPDLPAALASAVERCLAKAPRDRFQTGGDLAHALRSAMSGAGDPTMASPARDVRRSPGPAPADQQDIRFCRTADGLSLAYSSAGSGPVIVRVLNHFTHLEMEWELEDLRRFWEALAEHFTVVRFDGRGMGLSDPYTGDFTEETRQLDLAAVLGAVGPGRAALLGTSEGGWTAAQHVLDHPGRITHLVLYGAYCRGAQARPGYDAEEDQALLTLIRKGWGRDTPAFRQVFTSQFFRRDADPKLIAHFNELQRVSTDPDTAARYYASLHRRGDGRDLFRRIGIPTLVIHSRDDLAVSADEGRLLASIIPGAQLVLLPSGTHYFPTDAEIATRAAAAIARFLKS